MELVDRIFYKIKKDKITTIGDNVFAYMIAQTENYNEVQFITDKLKYYNISFGINKYKSILYLVEKFNDAIEILNEIKKINYVKKGRTNIDIEIYLLVMCTAKVLNEAETIFKELESKNVKIPFSIYSIMIDKQPSYMSAKIIYKDYLMKDGWDGHNLEDWRASKYYYQAKHILPSLYLKAKGDDEIQEVKNELNLAGLSLLKEDYYYLLEDRRGEEVLSARRILLQNIKDDIIYKFLEVEKNSIQLNRVNNIRKNDIPDKISKNIYLFNRNKSLVGDLKNLYENKCQICGTALDLGFKHYSEVHHIKPLYCNGEDDIKNMIVVCPNHHTLLDNGAIRLDLENNRVVYLNGMSFEIKLLKHSISKEAVDFHNNIIFQRNSMFNNTISDTNKTITYGSRVVLNSVTSKEEILVQIEDEKDKFNMSYGKYILVGHNVGDAISIENELFFISEVGKTK